MEVAEKVKEVDRKIFLGFSSDKQCAKQFSGKEGWPQLTLLRNFDKENPKSLVGEELGEA